MMCRFEEVKQQVKIAKILCDLYEALRPLGMHLEYEGKGEILGDKVFMASGQEVLLDHSISATSAGKAEIFRFVLGCIPFYDTDSVVVTLTPKRDYFIFGWAK